MILAGRGGQQLLEGALEVRLIGKAAFTGGRGDRQAAFQQPMAVLHAAIDQIGVRRQAVALAEGADQVGGRERGGVANVVQRQRLSAVRVDKRRRRFQSGCGGVSGWRPLPSASCRALKYSTRAICFPARRTARSSAARTVGSAR